MLDDVPDLIFFKNLTLKCVSSIDERDKFFVEMNRARNFFRHSFGDPSFVDINSTKTYVNQILRDRKNRRMFAVYYDKELIGQYGLRLFQDRYVLLDNAVRFNACGDKNAFSDVSKTLIKEIKKIPAALEIIIAVKKDNFNAILLHSYGNFIDLPEEAAISIGFKNTLSVMKFLNFK